MGGAFSISTRLRSIKSGHDNKEIKVEIFVSATFFYRYIIRYTIKDIYNYYSLTNQNISFGRNFLVPTK